MGHGFKEAGGRLGSQLTIHPRRISDVNKFRYTSFILKSFLYGRLSPSQIQSLRHYDVATGRILHSSVCQKNRQEVNTKCHNYLPLGPHMSIANFNLLCPFGSREANNNDILCILPPSPFFLPTQV